ncbi:MAG TPA: HEAT repeat domain-containing protein [Usitatibacter sp.]|nr:HEAT repeat domain-containing protein [Usitatibacter sp.]
MVPAAAPDLELTVAVTLTAGALAASVLLLATIAALRLERRWRLWRLGHREPAWLEVLHRAATEPAAARLAPIGAFDLPAFLRLWNRVYGSASEEEAPRLAQLLRGHGLHDRALRMLGRRTLGPRLIAITTLGHLREERAWAALEDIARQAGPVVSFAAARALLRIDARRALESLGPAIAHREDWPLARLGSVLHELGPTVVTPALLTLMASRPREGLERIVKLARFGQRSRVAPVVRGWLSSSEDPLVIVASLDYVEQAEDLPWVRSAARHDDWRVRMAGARALGRAGDRGELELLLDLLRDPVWWVRYHAAQALVRLQGLTEEELEALRHGARDAYAADMLAQALAERPRR